MPDSVFFDFAYWVPCLGRELGFKSIMYNVGCAALLYPALVPCKEMMIGNVKFVEKILAGFKVVDSPCDTGISLSERCNTSLKESDALAIRTCYEIEARFVDHNAKHLAKPVLLTGPLLPEKSKAPVDEKWEQWLNMFEPGSVVFCAFGSQNVLQKNQFQELLLGFELSGIPFLAALSKPSDCLTMEEAMPDGFQERVQEIGLVYEGWVPQEQILKNKSVGCFVSHGGSSSMWESLASDCQIVVIPPRFDHVVHSMIMVEELKVGIEVKKKEENGWISKESLSDAIKSVMSLESEVGLMIKSNHDKWRKFLLDKDMQETYLDTFISNLHDLLQ